MVEPLQHQEFGLFSSDCQFHNVQAREFYAKFVEMVKREYVADRVKDGVFGGEAVVRNVTVLCQGREH
jgi:hypothetical protein